MKQESKKGQKMEQQEQEKQEELKSRRNVAAKQGQRTRRKDCEERQRQRERDEEGRGEGEEGQVQGISATRESECCIYFPPVAGEGGRGHTTCCSRAQLALNSIKATEAATSVDPQSLQSTAQLASLPGSHVGSGF